MFVPFTLKSISMFWCILLEIILVQQISFYQVKMNHFFNYTLDYKGVILILHGFKTDKKKEEKHF